MVERAENTEAERQACEIRLRAERKAGQLLSTMEKAKGQFSGKSIGGKPTRPPKDAPTIKNLGISKDQSSNWQKLGNVFGIADRARLMDLLAGEAEVGG